MNLTEYLYKLKKKYYGIKHRSRKIINAPFEANLGDKMNIYEGPCKVIKRLKRKKK